MAQTFQNYTYLSVRCKKWWLATNQDEIILIVEKPNFYVYQENTAGLTRVCFLFNLIKLNCF